MADLLGTRTDQRDRVFIGGQHTRGFRGEGPPLNLKRARLSIIEPRLADHMRQEALIP